MLLTPIYFTTIITFVPILEAFKLKINETRNHDALKKYNGAKFVFKCCAEGEYVVKPKKCGNATKTWKVDISNFNMDFSDVPIYRRDLDKTGESLKDVYKVEPDRFAWKDAIKESYDYTILKHKHYLTTEQLLVQISDNKEYEVDNLHFCIDYVINKLNKFKLTPRFFTLVEDKPPQQTMITFVTYGFLVSSVFLTLVLLVYCLLPELQNLGGLLLMAYVASLLGCFLLLGVLRVQETPRHCKQFSKYLTFIIYFFLISSFSWSTVMSLDIWWTFRGFAKARPIHRLGEKFKFAVYCLCAWGGPLVVTGALVALNDASAETLPLGLPPPKIGKGGCFIKGYAKEIYLYVPMLALTAANALLYLMTAFNIWRIRRGTAMLDAVAAGTPAAHRRQKNRLFVYLKLSVIMGINWVLEAVSFYHETSVLTHIFNIYNVLIGFTIFYIFVCKRTVLAMLVKRYRGGCTQQRKPYNSQFSNTSSSDTESVPESPGCDPNKSYFVRPSVCSDPKGKNKF